MSHVTITNPHHFLFGHRLEVLKERSGRGPAYVVVALPDGRPRAVRIASTDLAETPTLPARTPPICRGSRRQRRILVEPLKKEMRPTENPKSHRQEFLKTVLFFLNVMPLVELGVVNLIPDPCDFDFHLRNQMMMARARSPRFDPKDDLRLQKTMEEDIRDGAISSLAGHKGFGLALSAALLFGPLVGALCGPALNDWMTETHGTGGTRGQLFIAIDPEAFGDPASFREKASAYADEIRPSRKMAGADGIRMPGERSFATRRRQQAAGEVEVYEVVWRKAVDLATSVGVAVPEES